MSFERENTSSGKVQKPAGSVKESGAHTVARVLGNTSAPSKGSGGGGMHIKIPKVRDQSKVK